MARQDCGNEREREAVRVREELELEVFGEGYVKEIEIFIFGCF